jgi:hypothetical protein
MIPPQNSNITAFFRNGVQVSGTVISWSDGKSAIKSLTGNKITVIQKTLEDVLFFSFSESNIKEEYEEVVEKPIKTNTDIQTLAELKAELNSLELEEISEKLRSHEPSGNAPVSYGSSLSMLFGGVKKQ